VLAVPCSTAGMPVGRMLTCIQVLLPPCSATSPIPLLDNIPTGDSLPAALHTGTGKPRPNQQGSSAAGSGVKAAQVLPHAHTATLPHHDHTTNLTCSRVRHQRGQVLPHRRQRLLHLPGLAAGQLPRCEPRAPVALAAQGVAAGSRQGLAGSEERLPAVEQPRHTGLALVTAG
jgi:hypothetical protein